MHTSVSDTVTRSKRPEVTISAEDAANGRITLSKQGKNDPAPVELTFNYDEFMDLLNRGMAVAMVVGAVMDASDDIDG